MFRQESGKNIGKVATVVKDISKTTLTRTLVNNLAKGQQAMKMSTNALQKATTSGINLISAKVPNFQATSSLKDFGASVQKRSLITQAVIQGPSKAGVLSTPKSNFSTLLSSSSKNSYYQQLGQGMNKNTGLNQVSRMETYGLWGAQKNSMAINAKTYATATQADFKVSGKGVAMNDNYFNQEFLKPAIQDKNSVNFSVTPVWSLPKGSEGQWGFYKPRKPMMVGNLKYSENPKQYLSEIVETPRIFDKNKMDLVLAPTDLHLKNAAEKYYKNMHIAAQGISQWGKGVYTGVPTTDDLKSIGVNWTLAGNSTSRTLNNEDDYLIALKTKIAIENGMSVILCIGDLLKEKQEGKTFDALSRQLSAVKNQLNESHWGKVVVAYEPEWNVCTDLPNSVEDAQKTAKYIRGWLGWNYDPKVALETRILYGGPIQKDQVQALIKQPDIDGLFVGQKSDKPEFGEMIRLMDDAVTQNEY